MGNKETFDAMTASITNPRKHKSIHQPFGITAEVRAKRTGLGSRTSNKNTNLSNSNQLDTNSVPNLSHNHSSAVFTNQIASVPSYPGHQRKKLPIGFLVQQEKRELHKMGMQSGFNKMRPDSAKVTLGHRSRALLSSDI